jgi:hypothetical protein
MNIYITLDYELFLGTNSGTIDNCLIRPMDAFLSILDKYQIKCTIFVDAAFLLRLKELSDSDILKEEYDKIVNHILLLHTEGHDIQLHFHPQWLYSSWKDGQWLMDRDHFKLSDMDEIFAFESFQKGCLFLESILKKKIIAFRAGGFSLATFNRYIELLENNGIKIDSSVCKGAYFKSKYQSYDYRNMPSKSIYRFSNSLISEDVYGQFIEAPVTTIRYNGLLAALRRKIYREKRQISQYGDGIVTNNSKSGSYSVIKKIISNLISQRHLITASIDGINSIFLPMIYSNLKNKGCEHMIILGHPKLFSNVTLQNTEEFIKKNISKMSFSTIDHLISQEDNYA